VMEAGAVMALGVILSPGSEIAALCGTNCRGLRRAQPKVAVLRKAVRFDSLADTLV
jgi:hypothetical protein